MASLEAVIETDGTPHSVAVSPNSEHLYVIHFLTDVICKVDVSTQTVVNRFPLRQGMYDVVATGDDKWLYVTIPSSIFVRKFSAVGGQLNCSAGINVRPYGISAAPHGLYAACPLDNCIELLEPGLKNIGRAIGTDFPVAPAKSPDGSRVYVSNYFSSTVSVIDATAIKIDTFDNAAKIIATILVSDAPYGIAAHSDGSTVYVGHFGSEDLVTVIDANALAVVDKIHTGQGAIRGAAVSPGGSHIYLTNYFSSSVSVLRL